MPSLNGPRWRLRQVCGFLFSVFKAGPFPSETLIVRGIGIGRNGGEDENDFGRSTCLLGGYVDRPL